MDQNKNKLLVRPSEHIVSLLAHEEGVITKDILAFQEGLSGLTEAQAMCLMDDLRNRRSWNMQTFMAAVEVLDTARSESL